MLKSLNIQFTKYHYAILIATLLVFGKGLNNQFNNWDDTVYVTENPNIALTPQHIIHSFTKGEFHGMYVPVTSLSLSLNYYFSGFHPKPYLVVNLLIHLINCILMFLVLQHLFKENLLTLFAGALFALHPMQAESVSYVAGRRDLLYVIFFLLAILQYLYYKQNGQQKHWRYVFLFFILSLFSKGQAIALPFTLILIDFLIDPSFSLKASVKSKTVLIALSIVFILITLLVKQQSKGFDLSGEVTQISFGMKCLFAAYGFMMYVVNLLGPFKLSLIHPYPEDLAVSASLIVAILFVTVVLMVSWKYRHTQKQVVFGVWFYILNIFLVLQIIPNSYGIMNDHYVYLAGLGIFISLYFGLKQLISSTATFSYALTGIAFCLAIVCFMRVSVFKDTISVYTDVIKKYPASFVAYNNRGNAYYGLGKINEALADYNKALNVRNNNPNTLSNRAAIYISQQQIQPALVDLNKAIELNPVFANAYSNRGIAKSMGNVQGALDDLNKAVELEPQNPKLYYNRAGYYAQTNQNALCCADVNKAYQLGLKQGNPLLDKLCH